MKHSCGTETALSACFLLQVALSLGAAFLVTYTAAVVRHDVLSPDIDPRLGDAIGNGLIVAGVPLLVWAIHTYVPRLPQLNLLSKFQLKTK